MSRSFLDAAVHRRSYHALKNEPPITDDALRELVAQAVKHVPPASNSQPTRIVVLLGEHHHKLWELTEDMLRAIVPADAFAKTEAEINESFQSGYGTILYHEAQVPV